MLKLEIVKFYYILILILMGSPFSIAILLKDLLIYSVQYRDTHVAITYKINNIRSFFIYTFGADLRKGV